MIVPTELHSVKTSMSSAGPSSADGTARQGQSSTSSPGQLDMISDPSRLLALYPIGGPHVPSSTVAHHVAPLTTTPLDLQELVPSWHLADDYTEQLRVLESGKSSNEQEQAWFERQVELVKAAAGLQGTRATASSTASSSSSGPSSLGQILLSLIPPPAPVDPLPEPMTTDESSSFFTNFIKDTLRTMKTSQRLPPPSMSTRDPQTSSPNSAQSVTPTKPKLHPLRRTSASGSASSSRRGGEGYQPSPLGRGVNSDSAPGEGREEEEDAFFPPSSSPLASVARTKSTGRLHPPSGPKPGPSTSSIGIIKLKRPVPVDPEVGGDSPKRRKEEEEGEGEETTPVMRSRSKGKGREGSGRSRTSGRTPMDSQRRLVDYIEDLLESVDTLPSYLSPSHPHFSHLTLPGLQPTLRLDVLKKLDLLFGSVHAWPTLDESDCERFWGLVKAGLEEVDWEIEREPKEEEMEVEETLVVSSSYSSPSYGGFSSSPPVMVVARSKKGKERARERDPEELRVEREVERGWSAGLVWKLMSLSGAPKLFFSEEVLRTSSSILKDLLSNSIYPSLLISPPPASLAQLCHSATYQLSSLSKVLSAVESEIVLSEDTVIGLIPITVGPFFAQGNLGEDGKGRKKGKGKAGEEKGKEGLKEIRLEALAVLRAIFGRYESQRTWVIQEILTSLVKLPDTKKTQKQFKLRNGQAIHIVSALLLQLIQSCAHGVKQQIRGKRLKEESEMIVDGTADDELRLGSGEAEQEEAQIYSTACDAAVRISKSIASFLAVSSASSKVNKSSEKEHRAVLDLVIQDLLTVLYWPEWPAASQLLYWFCKHMIASIKDDKASAEDNASKSIALDHLGHVGARMRLSIKKAVARERKPSGGRSAVLPLTDIVRRSDVVAFNQLEAMQVDVMAHLEKAASSDLLLLSAYEYTACLWGQELSTEIPRLPAPEPNPTSQVSEISSFRPEPIAPHVRASLAALWTSSESHDVFVDDVDDLGAVDEVSEEINLSRPVGRVFDVTLGAVLFALESSSVTSRTKALRALGHILVADSTILNLGNVRRSIENRLNDPSPAVRDVAVELIGQYLVTQSGLTEKYLPLLAERVDDTGLVVRKRVIKLLKTIYATLADTSLQAMIAIRLVQRVDDEDETVKDLAVKTIEELWFSDFADRAHSVELKSQSPTTNASVTGPLERKTAVIMTVASHFRDRHSALEVFLDQIICGHASHAKQSSSVFQHFKDVCESLIDTLIDAHDRPDLDIGGCVHALNQFSAAYPDCVSSSKASHLLPYLRHSTAPDDQAISISLLRVFNRSIRKMPKTSISFAQSLEKKVLPLINGAMGGWMGLQESIACLCTTVDHLTQNHERLVRLLGSCAHKLEQLRGRYQETGQLPEIKVQTQARPLLYIVALLGEYCDFDEIRLKSDSLANELNAISEDFMSEYIFDLVAFFDKAPVAPDLRRAALQSLGFLFRGYPTLMVEPSSLIVMDSVFASTDLPTKAVLLNAIHDFLLTQVERIKKDPAVVAKTTTSDNSVNMIELIGDTERFAESGVGSTIVQRYLTQILDAAHHPLTESIAVQIITFTVKQGLAHPIELAPVVIALETSSSPALANQAFALHSFLHHKHHSIVNTRFVENARACFVYQTKTSSESVRGFRLEVTVASAEPLAEALMGKWYELLRERRPIRKDFLRHIIRPFDFDTMADPSRLVCSTEHVAFCRFLADNLAALDYKTQEEVFIVIERLTAIISVSGAHLFDLLSCAKLDSEGDETPIEGQAVLIKTGIRRSAPLSYREMSSEPDELIVESEYGTGNQDTSPAGATYDALTLANLAIVMSYAFALKSHLKTLYQLSEDKCRKFDPAAKKSTIGDKTTFRRLGVPLTLDLEEIPFAVREPRTMGDYFEQCHAFITIAEEDGTNLEPDDDDS